MAFAGVGAGINELTALAATAELAPTAKRGKYVAVLVFTIIPFCPSVLWAQLIASHSTWRYIGLLCGLWAFIGFMMTAIFYFPPPRVNSLGLSRREIIAQIDFVGGFLSIVGIILFIGGLVWGGYMVYIPHEIPHKQDLTWITVRLDLSPRSCSTHSRRLVPHRLWILGVLWRQVPHVPKASPKRP
jgi:MFS family permease